MATRACVTSTRAARCSRSRSARATWPACWASCGPRPRPAEPPLHLIEIFLPLARGSGAPVDHAYIRALEQELTDRFGGVTACTRAPARGRWDDGQAVQSDDMVIL